MGYRFLVTRPLIFLCGPYEKNYEDENNRRVPITKFISEKFNNYDDMYSPYPFIVDYLFDKSVTEKYGLKISLVEEIVAAIAYRTYIFLDTPSTTMELGLFSNISSNNHIKLFYPKKKDFSQGAFVDLSIEGRKEVIEIIKYDYELHENVDNGYKRNYYFFPMNEKGKRFIPSDIIDFLNKDIKDIVNESSSRKINFYREEKNNPEDIEYFYNHDGQIVFKLNPKLLFYLILNLDEFRSFTKLDINKIDVDIVYEALQEVVFDIFKVNNNEISNNHFISKLIFKDNIKESVLLEVKQFSNIKQTIEHMYKITEIIVNGDHKVSHKTKTVLIDRIYRPVRKSFLTYKNYSLSNLLDITKEDKRIIKSYQKNYKKYVNKKHMMIKGKKRIIYSYSNNKYGNSLRELHEKLHLQLKQFEVHEFAIGYKENTSIKDAINVHGNNKNYIKTDIADFFGSISKSKLIKMFKIILDKNPKDAYENIYLLEDNKKNKNKSFIPKIKYHNELDVFDVFFINNKLPLGFVTSPVLSNIYMYFLDETINTEKVDYTRYADDILLSSNNKIDLLFEYQKLAMNLSKLGLNINKKKTHRIDLTEQEKYLKYLGMVIVDNEGQNKVKVSKSFIRETAKLNLNKGANNNIVVGRENFIKQISKDSFEEYEKVVKIMRALIIKEIGGK